MVVGGGSGGGGASSRKWVCMFEKTLNISRYKYSAFIAMVHVNDAKAKGHKFSIRWANKGE